MGIIAITICVCIVVWIATQVVFLFRSIASEYTCNDCPLKQACHRHFLESGATLCDKLDDDAFK